MLKRKARISKTKIKKLIGCFVLDFKAIQTSKLVKVNRNTVNPWPFSFKRMRIPLQF